MLDPNTDIHISDFQNDEQESASIFFNGFYCVLNTKNLSNYRLLFLTILGWTIITETQLGWALSCKSLISGDFSFNISIIITCRNLSRDRKEYFQWLIILSLVIVLEAPNISKIPQQPLFSKILSIFEGPCGIWQLPFSSESASHMTLCSHLHYLQESNFLTFWKRMLYLRWTDEQRSSGWSFLWDTCISRSFEGWPCY